VGAATAPAGGEKFLKAAIDVFKKLKESNFDYRSLSPPELRVLAESRPETYNAIVPPDVKQAMDSQEGRGAQLGGINYFEDIRDNGSALPTRIATRQAQNAIQDQFKNSGDSNREAFAARGRLGGGSELASRIGGDQQAMELASRLGDSNILAEYQARMNAAGQAAGIGTQERGQTIALNQGNQEAMNRFNEFMANAGNRANEFNAQARQRAGDYNVQNRQRVGDTNEIADYETALENIMRQNNLRGQNFGQQMARGSGLANAYGDMAGLREARRSAYIGNAQSMGQGIGSAVGGIGDLAAGGGAFGGGIQDFYRNAYGRQGY
jgi:hypothetical protein